MNVSVVGIGYVGLVTAGCLAEAGNRVICVDNDSDKIERLKNGQIPRCTSPASVKLSRQGRFCLSQCGKKNGITVLVFF